jgi:hypothetical protein|tara:strand:+ start:122 stop:412 length:291 start_codon:yes stop_codon:yes gene_type:complete
MIIIDNKDLILEMLPNVNDAVGIYNFALTLESTGGYDSFQEAHDNVDGKDKSLTDIRMELYFAAKTYDAIKVEEHVEVYQSYYDALVAKIKSGDVA